MAGRHSTPLRILSVGNVYPPHLLGGYEVVWRGVVRRLREQGDLTRVLTTTYIRPEVPPDAPDDPDVHRELDWYWRDHDWPRMGIRRRLKLERHNAEVFDRHLADFRPDVITWWPLGGLSLGLVERGRRSGVPAVLFVHDYWPTYAPQRDQWIQMWSRLPVLRFVVERATGLPTHPRLSEAGRWLFNSEVVRADTIRHGLKISNGAILSPGIEAEFLAAEQDAVALPWRWRLLYIGRVVEQKGVLTAVEAMAHLPSEASLRIVGEGDPAYRRELEAAADALGVSDRVQFAPPRPRPEIFGVYRDSDVVLFPVVWPEPWGLVPLEAMAMGRPVVATGRGGSGEFLRDQVNSLLFDAGDARALAQALQALASDEALRERLRESGYSTAAAYSEETFNRRAVDEIYRAAGRLPKSSAP